MIGVLLLSGIGCRPPRTVPPQRPALEIRYRPTPPPDDAGRWAVNALPDARWDAGLFTAVQSLLEAIARRDARLSPDVAALAAARAGYPGPARFASVLNGGALPAVLLADIRADTNGAPLDLALGRRVYADGVSLWVFGWSPRRVSVDPMPGAIPLDGGLTVRMDLDADVESRLFIAPPDGPVEELRIQSGVARWLDRFSAPGAYRMEVILGQAQRSEVALLFSVFVDGVPPPLPRLQQPVQPPPDPHQAEQALYTALAALRAERGLPPLRRFPLFEAFAREHAAFMGAHGVVRHQIPGVTDGVPARARQQTRPAAIHEESVAAAASVDEAMALIVGSPAHLKALLCADCTHVSIGAALEPVIDRPPRLFITWEMLRFPQGTPTPLLR